MVFTDLNSAKIAFNKGQSSHAVPLAFAQIKCIESKENAPAFRSIKFNSIRLPSYWFFQYPSIQIQPSSVCFQCAGTHVRLDELPLSDGPGPGAAGFWE